MRYLRRGLKALGWLTLALGGLTAVGLAALIAANWNDDALTEAAQEALQYTLPTEQALEGNGYLILMGLDAPGGGDAVEDAMALGRQRLAREIERRRWVEAHGDDQEGMPSSFGPRNAGDGHDVLPDRLRCPVGELDCFAWVVKHGDEVHALVKAHYGLLKRLSAAARAPQFSNPAPFYLLAEFPPYGLLVRAHELWLAQASLAWMHGQPQQAMDIARQAVQVRSRLANHSNSLIASMIALALQHRELRWLSDASAHRELLTSTATAPEDLNALLTLAPPSLRQALEGEKQFSASIHYSINDAMLIAAPWDEPPTSWIRLLNKASRWGFLPRQTLNMSIHHLQQVQVISDLPAHQMEPAFSEATRQWSALATCAPWKRLRNITGTCMAAREWPNFQAYVRRVADIDGYRRLVLLQHRAAIKKVAPPDMPAWLAQSPQELRNPYTLQPMQWDAAESSLVFEGREPQYQNPDRSPVYRVRLRG
jgi:hypothetical protein